MFCQAVPLLPCWKSAVLPTTPVPAGPPPHMHISRNPDRWLTPHFPRGGPGPTFPPTNRPCFHAHPIRKASPADHRRLYAPAIHGHQTRLRRRCCILRSVPARPITGGRSAPDRLFILWCLHRQRLGPLEEYLDETIHFLVRRRTGGVALHNGDQCHDHRTGI